MTGSQFRGSETSHFKGNKKKNKSKSYVAYVNIISRKIFQLCEYKRVCVYVCMCTNSQLQYKDFSLVIV